MTAHITSFFIMNFGNNDLYEMLNLWWFSIWALKKKNTVIFLRIRTFFFQNHWFVIKRVDSTIILLDASHTITIYDIVYNLSKIFFHCKERCSRKGSLLLFVEVSLIQYFLKTS